MVIQELKPSKRVQGRWLAVLEDGCILRVGEKEVVDFSLYAGKELGVDEAEALRSAARSSGLKEKTIGMLARKPMSRREAEQKLHGWEEYDMAVNLILSHEYYHYLEMNEIGLASRDYLVPMVQIGPLKLGKTGIRALSEVGAHAFARKYYELVTERKQQHEGTEL